MKRIAIICLLLAGLAAPWGTQLPAQAQATEHTQQVSDTAPHSITECTSECKTCQVECEKTLSYCLKQDDSHKEPKHIQVLKDCIATCKVSHDFMSRSSDLAGKVCSLCAEACKRCAESCSAFKDKVMQHCANECRKCEQSCRKMAS